MRCTGLTLAASSLAFDSTSQQIDALACDPGSLVLDVV